MSITQLERITKDFKGIELIFLVKSSKFSPLGEKNVNLNLSLSGIVAITLFAYSASSEPYGLLSVIIKIFLKSGKRVEPSSMFSLTGRVVYKYETPIIGLISALSNLTHNIFCLCSGGISNDKRTSSASVSVAITKSGKLFLYALHAILIERIMSDFVLSPSEFIYKLEILMLVLLFEWYVEKPV